MAGPKKSGLVKLSEDVTEIKRMSKPKETMPSSGLGGGAFGKVSAPISGAKILPIEPLLLVDGTLNGVAVSVLLDDGCSANIISTRLFEKNRKCFSTLDVSGTVSHSKRGSVEEISKVVLNGTLEIDSHTYTAHWVVSDVIVDVILGMTWRVVHNPHIDYVERTFCIECVDTASGPDQRQGETENHEMKATKSSATNFSRSLKEYSRKKKLQKRVQNVVFYYKNA